MQQRDSTGAFLRLRSASLRPTSVIAWGHENQVEATHRAIFGILCSLSDQRLTNIYLEGSLDLTTVVPRAPNTNQRMDYYPADSSGENLGAEERTLRRKGIVLAVVGALLIALAVLDGWPVV
jgi:hypothetical protein